MIATASVVESLVRESPLLEEGLATGVLNLSALARRLRPEVERALRREVSDAAVMMALKRLAPRVEARDRAVVKLLRQMRDLTVRSNLVEFTFRSSPTLLERQRDLLQAIAKEQDAFLTLTQGMFEVTLIASARLQDRIESVFRSERLVSRLGDLSAIVIPLPPKSVQTPGVHYTLLKQLAFHDLNVVEVVSTYSELTIVLAKEEVDRAFSVLKRFLWP
ncbi:MAG TPA: hypothetical protein VLW17_13355 [Thermoanaerobaculaceae bacterium]|nr:hypothetical protein [Thermoanaerobaculaceae bacterium]